MSLLRESIRKHLLLEKSIAQINANLTVTFDLRYERGKKKKSHGENRKDRDGKFDIRDYDVLQLVKKANDEISLNIVVGMLSNNSEFVITDTKTNLNVAILLKEITPYQFQLNIKTVMKHPDFFVSRDQVVIRV